MEYNDRNYDCNGYYSSIYKYQNEFEISEYSIMRDSE